MHNHHNTSRSRGFTLVELLVVIAIIVLLLGILVPLGLRALASSRDAGALGLLRTLETGIGQFQADLGYAPPLLSLDGTRGAIDPAARRSNEQPVAVVNRLESTRWHSVLSLPIYLLGVDNVLNEDFEPEGAPFWNDSGNEFYLARHDGHAGFGIRDPGRDRSWGGAIDRSEHNPTLEGRVYGPYVDARLAEHLRVATEEDFVGGDMISATFSEYVVLRDFWDQPIRYYREWPIRAGTDPEGDPDFRNGPAELVTAEEIEPWLESVGGEPFQPRAMFSSEYALLSAGRDNMFGDTVGVTSTNPVNFLTPAMVHARDDATNDDTSRRAYLEAIRNNLRVTR